MNIVFFDFDGTITTKDSLFDFIQFAVGRSRFWLGLIMTSPVLTSYALKLVPNHVAKEKFIAYYFKGWNSDDFQRIADCYSLEQLDEIIRSKALNRIKWHQTRGHKVVVVSASMECWLKAWCDRNNIDLISTRLEVKENLITGKFSTRNCYGSEKVNRIKKVYDLNEFEEIYAYGDSKGDLEMLSIAHKRYYRYFE